MRLDRFLAKHPDLSRRDVRHLLQALRVSADGQPCADGLRAVDAFSRIELDGRTLQAGYPARYLMLHKPAGRRPATPGPTSRVRESATSTPRASAEP